jgi:hypothetical protein
MLDEQVMATMKTKYDKLMSVRTKLVQEAK